MSNDGFVCLTDSLMNGTPEQQEEAARRLDEWFVEDQKKNVKFEED